MFDGELASLNTLFETETVKVPKPIKVWVYNIELCS